MTWIFRKRNPEKELASLCSALQEALGKRLKSVIVFGSFARHEYDPKRSNLNVLVVSELNHDALKAMGPTIKSWLKKGHVPPVLVAPDDIDDFARDFPIEFLDMQDHHRILWGDNILAPLRVDMKHLESQIEHDLALVQLRLRQALIEAQGEVKKVQRAFTGSIPSVLVLFKSTLRLNEESAAKLDKMQAAEELAVKWQLDPLVLKEVRDRRHKDDVRGLEDLSSRYLVLIEKALERLRKN